jgi:hypothetical protein
MSTREEYAKALKSGVYEICFKKKDGTFRVMVCTLVDELIPKTLKERTEDLLLKPRRKINPAILSVYDLEKSGWRSFSLDSVATFKKIK